MNRLLCLSYVLPHTPRDKYHLGDYKSVEDLTDAISGLIIMFGEVDIIVRGVWDTASRERTAYEEMVGS